MTNLLAGICGGSRLSVGLDISVIGHVPRQIPMIAAQEQSWAKDRNWPSRDDHFEDGHPRKRTLVATYCRCVNVGFRASIWAVATTAMGRILPMVAESQTSLSGLLKSADPKFITVSLDWLQ